METLSKEQSETLLTILYSIEHHGDRWYNFVINYIKDIKLIDEVLNICVNSGYVKRITIMHDRIQWKLPVLTKLGRETMERLEELGVIEFNYE